MRNFKYALIFLLTIAFSHKTFSQSKTKAITAVYSVAKKGLGVKSLKQLKSNSLLKKTAFNNFTTSSGQVAERLKVSKNLSESDILRWLKQSGYQTKAAQTNIEKIGLDRLRKIYANLEPETPYFIKKVIIDDFRNKGNTMDEILSSPHLIKAYSKVVAMGSQFRTNKNFLNRVAKNESPISIVTLNSKLEGQVLNGVKYVKRTIDIPHSGGLQITGVFPNFKNFSIFEFPIKDKLSKSDDEQFNFMFKLFQINLARNSDLQKKFTPNQFRELLSRKIISAKGKFSHIVPGHTWHHTEDGMIQLVETSIHNSVPHTGGRSLIGGGESLRYRNVD